MKRERVIVDFSGAEDAKKVEERVKTGYAEASIETLLNWVAVEEDLADSYRRMAESADTQGKRTVFEQLKEESLSNISELHRLLKTLEGLDRARVARIESLTSLLS